MKPVPPHLLAEYMARKLPSHRLAEILGVHPVTVRRVFKRPPRETKPKTNKRKLLEARELYRESISHLPIAEMCKLLHVTESTAGRIKRKYRGT